jgi:hypothetical protein
MDSPPGDRFRIRLLCSFGQGGQTIDLAGPHFFQHFLQRADAGKIRPIVSLLPGAPHSDKSGISQDSQVLRDRRKAHVDMLGDVAGGTFPIPDEMQDFPATWLSHDLKTVHENILADIEMKDQSGYNVAQA